MSQPNVVEIKGTHPTAHRIFIRWSDEDRQTVWITDGKSADDFYSRTVSVPADEIDAMISALTALKSEKP